MGGTRCLVACYSGVFRQDKGGVLETLVSRIAALEGRATSCNAIAKDFRVIAMQLARAEEKVLRMNRSFCTKVEVSSSIAKGPDVWH